MPQLHPWGWAVCDWYCTERLAPKREWQCDPYSACQALLGAVSAGGKGLLSLLEGIHLLAEPSALLSCTFSQVLLPLNALPRTVGHIFKASISSGARKGRKIKSGFQAERLDSSCCMKDKWVAGRPLRRVVTALQQPQGRVWHIVGDGKAS